MSTPPAPPIPDYNHLAADFDRYLPLVHPVTLALLEHLPEPAPGQTVLDVACGTGEPGLTLARRAPRVHLIGVDSAAAMLEVARSKAAREALPNIRFEVMPGESLTLASASVDAVISRFGLLMFGDVPASARELGRVLRAGGQFSLAVWDELAKNTLISAAVTVLRDYLPKEHASPMARIQELAAEGLRTRLLKDAGLSVVHSEMFGWSYTFTNFEQAWDLVSRMGNFTGQATLPPEVQPEFKLSLSAALAAYRQPAGAYVIPHACRLIWGQR